MERDDHQARAFAEQASQQPLLILAALIAVYIVLGVLYESLAHPLTIISTLPSAGLGALLALRMADMELSMTALIGVILASVVNLFLKSTTLEWIVTFVAIAVFLGLIAYDTQKLKRIHAMGFDGADNEKRVVILGALALYLDFINLFIQLLRIFGKRRN